MCAYVPGWELYHNFLLKSWYKLLYYIMTSNIEEDISKTYLSEFFITFDMLLLL